MQPKLVHFTEGGVWHGYLSQDYAKLWQNELDDLMAGNNPCAVSVAEVTPTALHYEVHYEQTK